MQKIKTERTLVVGCVHTPFNDKKATAAMFDFIKYWRPQRVILNGDTHDLWNASKYFKNPDRKYNLQEEMDAGFEFNTELRKAAGKSCEIVMNWGNHDYRYDRYITEQAPELLCIRDLRFEKQFGLEANGIIANRGKRNNYARYNLGPIRVGHFEVARKHSADTEQALVTDGGLSVIASHSHRKGVFYKTLADGTVLMGIGTGTLADETQAGMDYIEDANWQKGWVIVEKIIGKARFHVTDIPLVGGEVVFDGRLF